MHVNGKLVVGCNPQVADNYRQKGKSPSERIRPRCDLNSVEDVKNIVMQCPMSQCIRDEMFATLREISVVSEIIA